MPRVDTYHHLLSGDKLLSRKGTFEGIESSIVGKATRWRRLSLVQECSVYGVLWWRVALALAFFLFLSWLVSLKPWMIFLVTRAPKHCPGHVLRPYRHFTWRCTKYVQILSQYQHVAPLLLFFFRTDHCTKTHLLTTSGVLRCLEPFLSPFRSARNVAKGWPLRVL